MIPTVILWRIRKPLQMATENGKRMDPVLKNRTTMNIVSMWRLVESQLVLNPAVNVQVQEVRRQQLLLQGHVQHFRELQEQVQVQVQVQIHQVPHTVCAQWSPS